MTTLQTFFRAVVMLATLGIVAKAWMLYGPSVEEMQTIGQRVSEVADEWLNKDRQGDAAPPTETPDPRLAPVPALTTTLPPEQSNPPAQFSPQQPVQLASAESAAPGFAAPAMAVAPVESTPAAPPTRLIPVAPEQSPGELPRSGDGRLEAASAQLEQLGVRDYQVEPWGNDGRWYRCSCDAPWANAPNYSRHFEAVAEDATSAVEQVATAVGEWHQIQSGANRVR